MARSIPYGIKALHADSETAAERGFFHCRGRVVSAYVAYSVHMFCEQSTAPRNLPAAEETAVSGGIVTNKFFNLSTKGRNASETNGL